MRKSARNNSKKQSQRNHKIRKANAEHNQQMKALEQNRKNQYPLYPHKKFTHPVRMVGGFHSEDRSPALPPLPVSLGLFDRPFLMHDMEHTLLDAVGNPDLIVHTTNNLEETAPPITRTFLNKLKEKLNE